MFVFEIGEAEEEFLADNLVTLEDDGNFDDDYVPYDWDADAEAEADSPLTYDGLNN